MTFLNIKKNSTFCKYQALGTACCEECNGADLFDGGACFLLPLVTAQLHGAVNVGLSVVGAQDEQPEDHHTTNITRTLLQLKSWEIKALKYTHSL